MQHIVFVSFSHGLMIYYFLNPAGDASGKATIVCVERFHLQADQHDHNLLSQADIQFAPDNSFRIPKYQKTSQSVCFPFTNLYQKSSEIKFEGPSLKSNKFAFYHVFFHIRIPERAICARGIEISLMLRLLTLSLTKSQE